MEHDHPNYGAQQSVLENPNYNLDQLRKANASTSTSRNPNSMVLRNVPHVLEYIILDLYFSEFTKLLYICKDWHQALAPYISFYLIREPYSTPRRHDPKTLVRPFKDWLIKYGKYVESIL